MVWDCMTAGDTVCDSSGLKASEDGDGLMSWSLEIWTPERQTDKHTNG